MLKSILIIGVFLSVYAQQITSAEFFWDTDPGEGAGSALSVVDGNWDEALEEISAAPSNIPSDTGAHTLYIRAQGETGTWGLPISSPIYVEANSVTSISGQLPTITSLEFYWDTDPGEGSGTALTIADGAADEALEEAMKVASNVPADTGAHTLYVRALGAAGTWSAPFAAPVYIEANFVVDLSLVQFKIQQVESWCGNDPGEGAGSLMTLVSNASRIAEAEISISSSALTRGPNQCGIRAQGHSGLWGNTQKTTVFLEPDSPPFTVNITGTDTLCHSGLASHVYTIPPEFDATYEWIIEGGVVNSFSNDSANVTWDSTSSSHILKVVGTNTFGIGDTSSIAVSVEATPSFAIANNGNYLEVPWDERWTYSWTRQGVVIDSSALNWHWATLDGNYRAVVQTHCGEVTTPTVGVLYDANQAFPGPSPILVVDTFVVAENIDTGVIGTPIVTNANAKPVLWELSSADSIKYTIDASSGDISLNQADIFDYEVSQVDSVQVFVTVIQTGADTSWTYLIQIENANDNAPVVSNTGVTIVEHLSTPNELLTVSASDVDGDILSYAIVYQDVPGAFRVDSLGRVWIDDRSLVDYELDSIQTIHVQVNDPLWSVTAEVTITLTNQNEAPIFNNDSLMVAENLSVGDTLVQLNGVDPDASTLVYTMISTHPQFEINNGYLVLKSALDYESDSLYTLSIYADDGVYRDTSSVWVQVSNVNEAPSITSGSPYESVDTLSAGTIIDTIQSNDPDMNDSHTWTIVSGNESGYYSLSTSGVLTVASQLVPNQNSQLIVTVTDQLGLTTYGILQVNTVPADQTVIITQNVIQTLNLQVVTEMSQVQMTLNPGPWSMSIYNSLGAEVQSYDGVMGANGIHTQNISEQSPGIYWIQLRQGSQMHRVQTFIQ